MEFLKEYWRFLRSRKKIWMIPLIVLLLLASGLIIIIKGMASPVFIYTLF